MNRFLLVINILLFFGVAVSFGSNLNFIRRSSSKLTVVKRQPKKTASVQSEKLNSTKNTPEENINTIVNGDIFNPERTPNTGGPNSGRDEMTLVGTFKAGKVSGAIVIQRSRQRQFNPFMPQISFGPGGRFGGQGNNMRTADGRLGSMRHRFIQFNQQNVRGSNQSGQLTTGNRQCVKLGETLPNGYTLIEVGRASATLVRGSDRMELVLQDPSKVKTSSGNTGGRRLTTAQQLQQAQIATQQRMMQVMQNMQRSLNNSGGNRGFGNRGGRR